MTLKNRLEEARAFERFYQAMMDICQLRQSQIIEPDITTEASIAVLRQDAWEIAGQFADDIRAAVINREAISRDQELLALAATLVIEELIEKEII